MGMGPTVDKLESFSMIFLTANRQALAIAPVGSQDYKTKRLRMLTGSSVQLLRET